MGTTRQPAETTDHNASDLELLSSTEFKEVLRIAGFSHAEFADSIGKSRSFVTGLVNSYAPIKLRHVVELRTFLGESLYKTALALVRKQERERLQRREEQEYQEEQLMEKQRVERDEREAERRRKKEEELENKLTQKFQGKS